MWANHYRHAVPSDGSTPKILPMPTAIPPRTRVPTWNGRCGTTWHTFPILATSSRRPSRNTSPWGIPPRHRCILVPTRDNDVRLTRPTWHVPPPTLRHATTRRTLASMPYSIRNPASLSVWARHHWEVRSRGHSREVPSPVTGASIDGRYRWHREAREIPANDSHRELASIAVENPARCSIPLGIPWPYQTEAPAEMSLCPYEWDPFHCTVPPNAPVRSLAIWPSLH
mmetsp:Transcript_38489/g.65769  ORF Transcript_38489/g.65769 Transcript_38489/m.65769 type:complete len:227 (-) Transcript_38489:1160-1840(-)